MKVLIADKFEQQGIKALVELGAQVEIDPSLKDDALADALNAFDPEVLIVRSTKVPATMLEHAPSLRLIIRAGSGYDNIDCDAAAARGVAVSNCPGMNAVAVAELAMGLLLCCDRRLPDQQADLKHGKWNKKEYSKARGIKGMTLGVVGVGNIGKELIARAKAFGMDIIAWSRSMNEDKARALGVRSGGNTRADLLAMASQCDAISVHVALNDQTRNLCDKAFFDALKEGAYFINTARGGIADQNAMADAIATKHIRCGLDVFANQPTVAEGTFADSIIELPGVYGSHHCGASTTQAQLAVADEAVRIIRVYQETGTFENCVNGCGQRDGCVPTVHTTCDSERVRS